MRKRLISILIANVLFLSNVGFTSLAVEQHIDDSIVATTEEEAVAETDEESEEESQEASASDSYFDDIDYVKIQSFTELPEEIINQKLKLGGNIEELNFPDTLEIKVVADLDREDRIEEQLGRERELMRELEEEDAEAASSASSEDEEEEETEDEDEESDGSSKVLIDGEEVIFFGSDSDSAADQSTAESQSEEEEEHYEDYEEVDNNYEEIVSDSGSGSGATISEPEKEPETKEESTEEPEQKEEEQQENSDENEGAADETPVDEAPVDEGNDDAGEGSEPADGLISRIISVFRPLMVRAAEVEEPAEEEAEASDEDETDESGEGSDAADYESIEMVSGIEWILDPSRSDADTFRSDVLDAQFTFVPVLVIPDYYYIEAELPTITVTIVDEYYAFDEVVSVDDVKIRVRADEGVFPEGATLFAQKLQEEDEKKIQDKVEEQLEEETRIVKAYTFDIQIRDIDGNEIEPDTEKGRVFVSFETEEVSNEDYVAEIYHIVEADEPDDTEATAADAETNEETTEAAETDESLVSIDGEFVVNKLETAVVDGEEELALEAETDGFSVYTLVFSAGESGELSVSGSYLYLASASVKNALGISTTVSSVTIDPIYDEYLAAYELEHESGVPKTQKGVYKKNQDSGDWFLIVKKPFDEIPILVTPTGATAITAKVKNVNIASSTIINDGYPYATEMGSNTFNLKIATACSSSDAAAVYDANDNFYQWQYNTDDLPYGWNDIERANTNTFGTSIGAQISTTETFESGYWVRCLVNGVASKHIEVLTPSADHAANSITWPDNSMVGDTLCYVSNGTNAYTVVPLGTTQKVFDVVYLDNNEMLRTTSDNSGWSIYTDMSSTPSYYLDEMMFAFEDSAIIINADLASGRTNFAITANCAIGDTTTGTLYACQKDGDVSKVSYMEASKLSDITEENADDRLAFSVTPITSVSKVWVGTGTPKPFTDNHGKYLHEGTSAAIGVSWIGIDDGGIVSFSISAGTIDEIGAIGNTKTAEFSYVNSGIRTNITGARLFGNELTKYAESEGGYLDTVKVDMTFQPIGAVDSSVATGFKNRAGGELTSYNSDLSEVSSTKNNIAYIADYVDITVDETMNNDSEIKEVLSSVIAIELDYNVGNKEYFKVLRYHDDTAETLTAYSSRPSKGEDKHYYVDKSAGKVYLYTKKFSTYALAYKADESFTVTFKDGSTTLSTEKVKSGNKVEKPKDPTKEGYSFVGWTKDSSSTSTNVKLYDFDTKVTENLTLHAYYKKYYTVTFDTGTSKSTVQVASGEKVSKPSDPTMEGYVFKGWYVNGSGTSSSTSSSSSTSKSSATAYNFDTPVTKDLTLVAGWTSLNSDLEASKAAAKAAAEDDGDVNGARAPKTHDDLPIVWLWVLLLVSGITTFGLSAKAIVDSTRNPDQPKRRTKFQVYMLLAGILIKTTIKFIARKIRENKAKALLGLSTAVILVSCIVLASTLLQYHKTESLYSDADVTYVETGDDEEVDEYVQEIKELAGEEDRYDWWDCAQVNLKELKEEYPEVVGWIYFENENISYPIMYSGDNAKYLKTTYTGEKAKAGAIFIDGESTPDFTDPHSLIYGHNMRDLSMFGRLRYYMNTPGYYEDHQYFQIFTEDKVYRYQIFAYEEVADNHDVFWVYGKEPTGYYKMLKEIESGSYCNSGITTNESDHVITLATCTNKDDRRLIVSAVRTDEYEYAQ